MRRGLKVKSGVRAPSANILASVPMREYDSYPVAVLNQHGAEIGRRDFDTGPTCTTSPPCGHCWYCKQAVAK